MEIHSNPPILYYMALNYIILFVWGKCPIHKEITRKHLFREGGGGGGMSHWGLYINHSQSLSEKHPKRGWSDGTHSSLNTTPRMRNRGIAPRFPTLSADCPRTCLGDLWIWYPFFHIFLFTIHLTRYARYAPSGEKDTLFTRFYWCGWCTGPNETCPSPRTFILP